MDWLAGTEPRRADPRALWPEVRSIVMLGIDYGPADDPLANLRRPDVANVSVYARNRDYHDVIKGRLKQLAQWLAVAAAGKDRPGVKVFVDTAPVMEKPLAEAAGLGWQGKHTNLVSRGHGSWLFLGSIFTTLALPPDAAERDHCGCDDCLAVCPWNKWAQAAGEAKLQPRADLISPPIAQWLALDDAGFRALFSGSPVKRLGFARFMRNLLIAAGNSGDRSLMPAVARHLAAPPLVREMAAWALGELASAVALPPVLRDTVGP